MLHLWGSVFAPVGRGTPGHPDRDRQRHERQEDSPFAGTRPVRHQQGDQAQHVVPVQRERVLPAVPAEASEDGARGRAATTSPAPRSARPTGAGRSRASHTACHSAACGRGWTNGRVEAGRRRRSAASSAVACPNARSSNPVWRESSRRSSTRPTTGPCACSATSRPPRHSPTSC